MSAAAQTEALSTALLQIYLASELLDVLAKRVGSEAGVEQLDEPTISTMLRVVRGTLERAQAVVQASFPGKSAEVVNG